jgi:shikimate kinase
MKKEEMDKLVGEELDHIPRAEPGSLQNYLRLYYSGLRKTSLRKDAAIKLTKEDVLLQAINELKKNGIMILLKADLETTVNRIKDGTQRPSLTGKESFAEEVKEVLNQRKKKYEDAADYSIDTSKLTVHEVMTMIISYLKKNSLR